MADENNSSGGTQNLGNLVVHVDANINGLNTSLKQGQDNIRTFTNQANNATKSIAHSTGVFNNIMKNSFRYIVLHAIIVKGALETVRFGINSVKNAMNMIETENLFNVSMGNMADTARNWSNEMQSTLGLNAYNVRKNIGVFYNMTTAMGLTNDKAYEMSKGLTGLAYDMASFYNLPYEDAFTKLQAGITGEIEPLRRLGVLVTDNVIKNYAYAHGLAKVGAVLTEQQKVLARYGVILDSTKTAQGDLARTLASPANQARLLSTNIELLSINIGRMFLPIIQAVIPHINRFVSSLSAAANTAANFMENIFGVDYSGFADSSKDASDAQGDLAKNIGKAGKAAKNSIASFDVLNVLQQKDDAGAGVIPSGDKPGKKPEDDKPGPTITSTLKTVLESPDFKPLMDSLSNLKKSIQPFVDAAFSGLKWLYDNVLVPLGKWTIGSAIPAFLNLLGGAIGLLNPLLIVLKPMWSWLWDNFFLPLAQFTGGVAVVVINGVADALSKIGVWISNNKDGLTHMTELVTVFFGAWKLVQLMAFLQYTGGVTMALLKMKSALELATLAKIANIEETIRSAAIYGGTLIKSIATAVVAIISQTAAWVANTASMIASSIAQTYLTVCLGAWNVMATIGTAITTAFGAAVAFLTSPIGLVLLAIAALIAIVVLLVNNWDAVKLAGAAAWEWIKTTWAKASKWFTDFVVTPILFMLETFWTGVGDLGSKAWEFIKEIWTVASGWFTDTIITPVLTVFDTLWSGIGKFGSEAWEGLKSIWTKASSWFDTTIITPIQGLFKGLWNNITSGMNVLIRGLNSIHFEIPDWVPIIGGKSFGIHLPEIPRLAKGGLVSGPTLALVGDNPGASSDPEVVSPLSTLKEMLAGDNYAIVQVLAEILDVLRNINPNIELDGDVLTKYISKSINKENNRIGKTMVTIGGVQV